MSKQKRFILFLILVFLFFLAAPLVIFYSQGYRFNFKERKITQTGAFSFKTWPKGASVYINDKLVKKTDFLFGNAFIDNLFPKKYKVEIIRDGYYPWQKNLEVVEKWTTEAKNIFLVPKNPEFTVFANKVKGFYFSPDNKRAILKRQTDEGITLDFWDLEKNNLSSLVQEKDLIEKGQTIQSLTLDWSADSRKILIKLTIDKKAEFFILDVENKEKLIPLDFLGENFSELSFDPENSQRIFFIKNLNKKSVLLSADYRKKAISEPILEDLIAYKISSGSLYWLDKNGFLSRSNFAGMKITDFNLQPITLKKGEKYQIFIFQENIFLKEGGNLYLFNDKKQSLEKISEKTNDLKISTDDLKKIVYFTDSEIWVLFIEKIEEQPKRAENERLFLSRFSEKIGDVFWWTNHYLIFSIGNIIKIAEIDDRDRINIYDLANFPNPDIFWNKIDKKLYLLSDGNLYNSEKLLP